eukprot:snap_masked-scaffold_9-processed-gene-6.33-mRNA-1 protein AED:0.77 eAED:0.77 QI:0/0/0/0.5/1/1/2/0/573
MENKAPAPVIVKEDVSDQVQEENGANLTSLYMEKSKTTTYLVMLSLLLNAGLMVFSHLGVSAVIFSSICPSSIFAECGDDLAPVEDVDLCLNQSDLDVLLADDGLVDNSYADRLAERGLSCLGAGSCVAELFETEDGLSSECASCFGSIASCSLANCASPCLGGQDSQACVDCSSEFCLPAFEECTGLDMDRSESEITLRFLQENEFFGECIPRDSVDLWPVFNLTFVNSVDEAWHGDVKALAVFIVAASGIWPYLKNVMMVYVWFKKIEKTEHGIERKKVNWVLRPIIIYGKWSLVDVFAVIFVIIGVYMNKSISSDILLTESRPGIYAFVIALGWELLQAEWIKIELDKTILQKTKEEKTIQLEQLNKSFLTRNSKKILLVSSFFSLVVLFGSMFTVIIEYRITGIIADNPGDNVIEYTPFTVATELLSKCFLHEDHGSYAGAYFLVISYIFFGFFTTYTCLFAYVYFSMTQNVKLEQMKFIGMYSNAASLDVFLCSGLVLVAQYKKLIASAIGTSIDEECNVGENQKCLVFEGSLREGFIVVSVSVVFFWIAQIAFVKYKKKSFVESLNN